MNTSTIQMIRSLRILVAFAASTMLPMGVRRATPAGVTHHHGRHQEKRQAQPKPARAH
jgi:hypothetical protein